MHLRRPILISVHAFERSAHFGLLFDGHPGPNVCVGYAIVQHTIDRETGMRRSMLADILVEQDDSGVTEALLEAAYSNAVASGGHLFEVVGMPRHIRQILKRWNPYVRTYPTDPLIYKTADEPLARTLADENTWYAGPLDGDTTLMP